MFVKRWLELDTCINLPSREEIDSSTIKIQKKTFLNSKHKMFISLILKYTEIQK